MNDECTNHECEEVGHARYDHYGIYAGRLCDECWEKSGIRKDDYYDPDYAGESLEEY